MIRYTKQIPDRDGYYWLKSKNIECIVEIAEYADNTVRVLFTGDGKYFKEDNYERPLLSEFKDGYEWAGPIPKPLGDTSTPIKDEDDSAYWPQSW